MELFAADRRGLGRTGPGEPLDRRKSAEPRRCHGSGALSSDCRNQKAASDPSHVRRVAPHWDKAIRRTLGPHQTGAGGLECLRPTDIANAFGTLHRERVLGALEMHVRGTERDPFCGTRLPNGSRHAKDHHSQRFCLPPAKDRVSTKHRIWLTLMTSQYGKEGLAGSARAGIA